MAEYDSSITAYFGGDTSGLSRAITGAEGMVGKFQSALGKIGLTIGAGAVIGFFKSVVDRVSQIQDMSDALDVNTTALQSFGFAVEKAGMKAYDAGQLWRTTRKSVDELAAGNEKAVATFEKLGLTQKDLINLPLDKALEKIAQAYVANEGKAGAYAAVTDIVGSRSAKLMGILKELGGAEGFGGLEAAAKSAGNMLSEDTIKRIDQFGDRVTALIGAMKASGAGVLDFALKASQGWGAAAAVIVNKIDGINTDYQALETSTKKVEAAIGAVTGAVIGQAGTVKDFAAFNESEFKNQLARFDMEGKHTEKMIALQERAKMHLEEASKYGENTKEQLDHIAKSNALILQYDQEKVKANKEVNDALDEVFGEMDKRIIPAQQEQLSLAEQLGGELEAQIRSYHDTEAIIKRMTAETQERAKAEGIIAGIMTSSTFGREETPIIKERIRRNNASITGIQTGMAMGGTPTTNSIDRGEIARLTLENNNLQAELRLREMTVKTFNQGGYDKALAQFPGDPRFFDDFLRTAQGTTTEIGKTNQLLDRIGKVVINTFGG